MGPDAMTFVFEILSFKLTFSFSSFIFIKRLFSSSLLSAIRVVSSPYLRLLLFLLSILIPACNSSRPAFHMMCSAYKLNEESDNEHSCTPFSILNQSVVPYRVLTCFLTCIQVSQETGKMIWYSDLFKTFPHFVMIHPVRGFSVVNETGRYFSGMPFYPINVGNLISGFSALSKPSLNIWKFSDHIILKPSLEDF